MNNDRCLRQNSLITVRKWLFEGSDTLSRFDQNFKANLKKTSKRKRLNHQKHLSPSTSIISWFYQFIKNIFTVYKENPIHHDESNHTIESTITYSTGQSEHLHARVSTIEPKLKWNRSHSVFQPKVNSKIMVTTATSSSNLNTSQSMVRCSSKFSQTRANHQARQSKTYPLYCISVKDGQILPLQFSSALSVTIIPLVKKIISCSSSSPLCMDKEKFIFDNLSNSSEVLLSTTDRHSYPSYQSTIGSISSSHSNLISLQTTENFKEDPKKPMIHRPSVSLHNTPTCRLHERYHSSNMERNYPSVRHHSSETHAPEIVFAESTCQLIKQAWSLSPTDQ